MEKRKTLWDRNFTIITLGTVISAIGGTAMNLAMGLVVFDNTSSAWMTGFFTAISMLPSAVLPVLIAPYVDSHRRKPMIVGLDALLGVLYLAFAAYLSQAPFSYGLYMTFGFVTSAFGSVYNTAYEAFYPDLIPEGFMQKGYSVSSIIYPTITMLVTPVAAIVYTNLGMPFLFMAEGVLLLVAAAFESQIRLVEKQSDTRERFNLRSYGKELLGGIRYLKEEKGIRSLYAYMSITNAASSGINLMVMTFFQSASWLTTAMYSLLISAETLGRMLGGILHYMIRIPRKLRYRMTVYVYNTYELLDGGLLFLPYPLMLAARFICGFLGVNSATLRQAAVQHYLPPNMRARVNSLFHVIINAAVMLVQLAAGALGEVVPYRVVAVCFSAICLVAIQLLIVRNRKHIEPLYDVDF